MAAAVAAMKAGANNSSDASIVCYVPTMITTNGIWQGDNPLDYSLPLFILQLTMVVVTTRILVIILKPFRQPRVISEIMVHIHNLPSYLLEESSHLIPPMPLPVSHPIFQIITACKFFLFSFHLSYICSRCVCSSCIISSIYSFRPKLM